MRNLRDESQDILFQFPLLLPSLFFGEVPRKEQEEKTSKLMTILPYQLLSSNAETQNIRKVTCLVPVLQVWFLFPNPLLSAIGVIQCPHMSQYNHIQPPSPTPITVYSTPLNHITPEPA